MARCGIVAAIVGAISACGEPTPEFSGVGKYRIGSTTRADVKDGRCDPTDIEGGTRKATWCYGMASYKIANRVAQIELYFEGTEPTGPLIEMQLTIRGCLEQDLDAWMRTNFGPPIETRAERAYWKTSVLWAAALMPSEPGRCRVHFLPLSETREIERIHKE